MILSKGVALWFTGLSGAGKTMLCQLVWTQLVKRGVSVEVLDGDVFRSKLFPHLGFSKEDRQRQIEGAAYVAELLSRNEVIVLAAFITPYQEMRDFCRRNIGSYAEVYVNCSLSECIKRDVKGLYKKAINGEIDRFTGISDPFEEPANPDLIVNTCLETEDESAESIMKYLISKGFL